MTRKITSTTSTRQAMGAIYTLVPQTQDQGEDQVQYAVIHHQV